MQNVHYEILKHIQVIFHQSKYHSLARNRSKACKKSSVCKKSFCSFKDCSSKRHFVHCTIMPWEAMLSLFQEINVMVVSTDKILLLLVLHDCCSHELVLSRAVKWNENEQSSWIVQNYSMYSYTTQTTWTLKKRKYRINNDVHSPC